MTNKAARPPSPQRFAGVSALKRAEALRDELGAKPTSLLISNEKAALEQCVRALIDREKKDEARKQEALQEWAMLAAQEEEEKKRESEELLEEKQVAEEEEDFSLKQAREAVGAATQRVEGKLRAMKEAMEADIVHEQEETAIEQQKAKLALAEAEEESLDKVQSYRDGRWKVYEAEVAQLQSGLVDAKGNIDMKIAASREKVLNEALRLSRAASRVRLNRPVVLEAEAGVIDARARMMKERLVLEQNRELLQDAEDALNGARGRAEEAAKRIAREEARVGDEKDRLSRQAKDNDRTVAAEVSQLKRDLANKHSMLDKYINVTKEQVRQEKLQLATQQEKLRAAATSATTKRRFAVEQAAERVLEGKRAAAMAGTVLETATEEHNRMLVERAETIKQLTSAVQSQQAENEITLRDLQETHAQSLDDAADRLKVERLALEADLAARVTRITEQEGAAESALQVEQVRVEHMQEGLWAGEANLESLKAANAADAEEAATAALRARELWEAEYQAHAEEERHKEEVIKQAMLDRDGYQAELLKEADGTHWATVQRNQQMHDAMLEAEQLKQKAKDDMINAIASSEMDKQADAVAVKERRAAVEEEWRVRKEAQQAQFARAGELQAQCVAALGALEAQADAALAQMDAQLAALEAERAAVSQGLVEATEALEEEQRETLRGLDEAESDRAKKHEEEREDLLRQRTNDEAMAGQRRRQIDLEIAGGRRRVDELASLLHQLKRDAVSAEDAVRDADVECAESKMKEQKLRAMAEEAGDEATLHTLKEITEQFVQLRIEGNRAPGGNSRWERALVAATAAANSQRARFERRQALAAAAHAAADARVAARHDGLMRLCVADGEAAAAAAAAQRAGVVEAFSAHQTAMRETAATRLAAVEAHLEALSTTREGAEVRRQTLAAVPERRAALAAANEARLAEEAAAVERMLAEEAAAVGAVESDEAALERRQTLAAAAAAAEYEAAVERCEQMKEEAQRSLDQWKADNSVRLVELKAAEAKAEARLEELRETGDSQRRAWQDKVRARKAAEEAARRLEVVAAKDRQDSINKAGEELRKRRQELSAGQARVEAEARKLAANQAAAATERQAAERSFRALLDSKERQHAAYVDEATTRYEAQTREARAELQRKELALVEAKERAVTGREEGEANLKAKAEAVERAVAALMKAEETLEEERAKAEMEEGAYDEMIAAEEEKLVQESAMRERGFAVKLGEIKVQMDEGIATLEKKIAATEQLLGKGLEQIASVEEASAATLEHLRSAAREAVARIGEEEAKMAPLRAAAAAAASAVAEAEAHLNAKQAELAAVQGTMGAEMNKQVTDADALEEASHQESKALYEQFEADVARMEKGEQERLHMLKVDEAEEKLARRRRLQRWIAERRTRFQVESETLRKEVDKAKEVEATLVDGLVNKKRAGEKELHQRKKAREHKFKELRKALTARHRQAEATYEADMTDLMMAMEKAKARLLAREAEEKEQQWMFREAQATVAQRATSATARSDLHMMQTYQEAYQQHQAHQMQEQANQWDQAQAEQLAQAQAAHQRAAAMLMRPSTAAATSTSYGGVVPSVAGGFAPPAPPATAGAHRPRSRRVSQTNNDSSRPSSGNGNVHLPDITNSRAAAAPTDTQGRVTYRPGMPTQFASAPSAQEAQHQEALVQQFERERARMQTELAELSKQRAAMAAAQR